MQASNGFYACATLSNWRVKCWGSLVRGLAGNGNTATVVLGDNPGEVGDGIPYIDLGPGAGPVYSVAVGEEFACAQFWSGGVRCWGANDQGQLGQGHTADVATVPGVNVNLGWSEPVDAGKFCKECSNTCPGGGVEFAEHVCGEGADTICHACSPPCSSGEYEASACTNTDDRVCARCLVCSAAASPSFEAAPCNASVDAVCVACRPACTAAGEWESRGCGGEGGGDRVCSSCVSGTEFCPVGYYYYDYYYYYENHGEDDHHDDGYTYLGRASLLPSCPSPSSS
eukprot:1164087-Rhodomonas_salina.2